MKNDMVYHHKRPSTGASRRLTSMFDMLKSRDAWHGHAAYTDNMVKKPSHASCLNACHICRY